MVEDVGSYSIQRATFLDIDPRRRRTARVRCIQVADGLRGVLPCVLCQSPWHHFETLRKLADRVLLKTGRRVRELLKPRGDLDLSPSRTGYQPAVLADPFVNVDGVLERAVQVVECVLGGGAEHDGSDLRVLGVLAEDDAFGPSDFINGHGVAATQFLLSGSADAGHANSVASLHDTAELKLGWALDNHDVEALQEVKGHLGDGTVANDDGDASVGHLFDHLLHCVLFGQRILFEFLGGLEEHCPLGLRG
mmetsp:Transcript_87986/g.131882  ORF Transcript_87986/g.131882 Transcript_87986/m.131882 type:complete len:250 (+) Transcript_87986:157-906(+)